MALNEKDLPSAQELTAHVRTAVDGAVRWLDRALVQPHPGPDAWDQAGFYARMLMMRGLERGELLGWVLQRDRLAAAPAEAAVHLRQAQAYWQESRPDLHRALEGLRSAADLPPTWETARIAVCEAREQMVGASGWLMHLSKNLGQSRELPEVAGRTVEPASFEPSLGLDTL